MFQLISVLVMTDVVVIFFSSIIVLTPNGNFWIVPLLHLPFLAVHPTPR